MWLRYAGATEYTLCNITGLRLLGMVCFIPHSLDYSGWEIPYDRRIRVYQLDSQVYCMPRQVFSPKQPLELLKLAWVESFGELEIGRAHV